MHPEGGTLTLDALCNFLLDKLVALSLFQLLAIISWAFLFWCATCQGLRIEELEATRTTANARIDALEASATCQPEGP